MESIKTRRDIEGLWEPVLRTLLKEVCGYFEGVREAYDGDGGFTLEEVGPIVVLEHGDDLADMTAAMIGAGGLTETCPEAVEKIMLERAKTPAPRKKNRKRTSLLMVR